MIRLKASVFALAMTFALPAFAASDNVKPAEGKDQAKPVSNEIEVASNLTHRHRHCHVVITLGHSKKQCHSHRHNKIAHHGFKYH